MSFVERFARPLLLGGAVALGLPLDEAEYAGLLEGTSSDPEVDGEVRARARTLWSGALAESPTPAAWAMAALAHDLLVGLHPSSGRSVPGGRYLARLCETLGDRSDGLPSDPDGLLLRWVVTEAALTLTREDTFIQFHLLGSLEGFGERPTWWDLPWRQVEKDETKVVRATDGFTPEQWDTLARISPLSAARLAIERGDSLPAEALAPVFGSTPLCRWLAREIVEADLGAEALARTLAEHPWPDPFLLRQWLGLALYVAADRPPSGGPFAGLLAGLAPYARTLGAPPFEPSAPPAPWVDTLIHRARLTRDQPRSP